MILLILAVIGMFVLLGFCAWDDIKHGGGSWIKEDGTIIEWDGDGGGRILHPDGRLDEFPAK